MELNPECQDIKANNNQVTDNDNTIDCLLDKFTENYVQVELIKELVNKSETNLRKRKEDLKTKLKKLDELHNRIFQMGNDFCESVWNFTADHDFASVINQILDDNTLNIGENNQIQPYKISSTKNDVKKIICDVGDLIMNIDKALIDINRKLVAEVYQEIHKPIKFDDNPHNPSKKAGENLMTIKKELDFKVPVKIETPDCENVKISANFSVKKKSSICKKFESLVD